MTLKDILPFVTNIILPGNTAVFPHKVEKAIYEVLQDKYGSGWEKNDKVKNILKETVDDLKSNFISEHHEEHAPYAYSAYYIPQNFHKVQCMLLDLIREGAWKSKKEIVVLDIGCDTGTTALSVVDFFEVIEHAARLFKVKTNLEKITVFSIDKNKNNLVVFDKIRAKYMEKLDPSYRQKIIIKPPLCVNIATDNIVKAIKDRFGSQNIFDLILMSNTINQLGKSKLHTGYSLLSDLKQGLAPDGTLFLIEPDKKEDTICLRKLGKKLQEKKIYNVFAPCGQIGQKPHSPACENCWTFRREILNVPDICKVIEDQEIVSNSQEINEKIAIKNCKVVVDTGVRRKRSDKYNEAEMFLHENITNTIKREMEDELKLLLERRDFYLKEPMKDARMEKIRQHVKSESTEFKLYSKKINEIKKEAEKKIIDVEVKIRHYLKNVKCPHCKQILMAHSVTKHNTVYLFCRNCGEKIWANNICTCHSSLDKYLKSVSAGEIIAQEKVRIQEYESMERAIEIAKMLTEDRISNWKKELVHAAVQEEYYEKQWLFPKLRWSYIVLKHFKPIMRSAYPPDVYQVVSNSLYVSEVNGKPATIFKMCNQDEVNYHTIFLRFKEELVPEDIRFGDIVSLEGLNPQDISAEDTIIYKKAFGNDFTPEEHKEFLIDSYKKAESITFIKSISQKLRNPDLNTFDYFNKYYEDVISLYDESLKKAEIEAEIDKKAPIKEKKEELRYFLTRMRPDLNNFWDGQFNTISRMMGGRKLSCIMATGGGKSLCFQMPALLARGVSIVICPLRSLMEDQVSALKKKGLFQQTTYISGVLSPEEKENRLRRMTKGYYKLIYFTPEQFQYYDVLKYLKQTSQKIGIDYLIIDEAHCVSQWGHAFRPAYLMIKLRHKNYMPDARLSCFTATASDKIIQDLKLEYGFEDAEIVRQSFFRKELCLQTMYVDDDDQKLEIVHKNVKDNRNNSPLIFTPFTIGENRHPVYYAQNLSDFLKREGVNSEWYHSNREGWIRKKLGRLMLTDSAETSMDKKMITHIENKDFERRKSRVMKKFIENKSAFVDGIDVLCATKGFGMGIDKGDIEVIIHTNLPSSYEDYYQQIGRAARKDGLTADCILLISRLPSQDECDKGCLQCTRDEFDCYKQAWLLQKDHNKVCVENANESLIKQVLHFLDKEENVVETDGCIYKFINLEWSKQRKEHFITLEDKTVSCSKKMFSRVLNVLQRCDKRKVLDYHELYTNFELESINYDYIMQNVDREWIKDMMGSIRKHQSDKENSAAFDLRELALYCGAPMMRIKEMFDILRERYKRAIIFKEDRYGREWSKKFLEVLIKPNTALSMAEVEDAEKHVKDKIIERQRILQIFIEWVQEKNYCKKEKLANYFLSNERLQSKYCYACDVCAKRLLEEGKIKSVDECDREYLRQNIADVRTTKYDDYFITLEQAVEKSGRTASDYSKLLDHLNEYAECLRTKRYGARQSRPEHHYGDKDQYFFESSYVLAKLEYVKGQIEQAKRYFAEACATKLSFFVSSEARITEPEFGQIIEYYKLCSYVFSRDGRSQFANRLKNLEELSALLAKTKFLMTLFERETAKDDSFEIFYIRFVLLRKKDSEKADEQLVEAVERLSSVDIQDFERVARKISNAYVRQKTSYEYVMVHSDDDDVRFSYLKEMMTLDVAGTFEYMRKQCGKESANSHLSLEDLKKVYQSTEFDIPKKMLQTIEDILVLNDYLDYWNCKTDHDIKLKCHNHECGEWFTFSVAEQNFYARKKEYLSKPKRCPRCRLINKVGKIDRHKIGALEVELRNFIKSEEYRQSKDIALKFCLGEACFYNDKNIDARRIFTEVKDATVDKKLILKCKEYLEDLECNDLGKKIVTRDITDENYSTFEKDILNSSKPDVDKIFSLISYLGEGNKLSLSRILYENNAHNEMLLSARLLLLLTTAVDRSINRKKRIRLCSEHIKEIGKKNDIFKSDKVIEFLRKHLSGDLDNAFK